MHAQCAIHNQQRSIHGLHNKTIECLPNKKIFIKREEEVEKAVVDERANANRHKPATAIICMQTNSFDDKAFYPQSTSLLMRLRVECERRLCAPHTHIRTNTREREIVAELNGNKSYFGKYFHGNCQHSTFTYAFLSLFLQIFTIHRINYVDNIYNDRLTFGIQMNDSDASIIATFIDANHTEIASD